MRERARKRTPESWTRSYALLRPRYERYARSLERLMKQLLDAEQITYEQVDSRVKSPQSFADKLRRKPDRYGDPLVEMPDTVGVRIVVHFRSDVERVRELIGRELSVDDAQTRRPTDRERPEAFGYSSLHLVVRVDSDRVEFPEWVEHSGLRAEIQVRTILEHAWAAIDHRLRYKRDEEWSPDVKRVNARIAAQLESADEEFERLRQEVLATEPVRPPGQTATLLDEFELGRMLDDTGIKDRWWALALENGFVADKLAQSDSAPEFVAWSLLWLRLVASIAGINTVSALRETLDRVGDDDARATLRRVASGARALADSPLEVQIWPYDPVSIVLHVNRRISPAVLVDVANFTWRDDDAIGDFVQGWLGGMVVEAIERVLEP